MFYKTENPFKDKITCPQQVTITQICQTQTVAVSSIPPMTFRPLTQSAATLFWSPTLLSSFLTMFPNWDTQIQVWMTPNPNLLASTLPASCRPSPASVWGQCQGWWAGKSMLWGLWAVVMWEKTDIPWYSGTPASELGTVHNKGNSLASPTRKLLVKTKVLTHILWQESTWGKSTDGDASKCLNKGPLEKQTKTRCCWLIRLATIKEISNTGVEEDEKKHMLSNNQWDCRCSHFLGGSLVVAAF